MALTVTNIKEHFIPPDLDYGWQTTFYDKYSVTPRPGLVLARGAVRDTPNPSYYLNKGVGAILVPSGVPNDETLLPASKKFVLSGRSFAYNATGGKQFRDWTFTEGGDADKAADAWVNGGSGAKYTTGDLSEVYDGTGMYEDQNPGAYKRFYERIGDALAARGQGWYGDYDGPFLVNNDIANPAMHAALNSKEAARAFLSGRPYFKHSLWQHNVHTILNSYFRGSWEYHVRMFEHAASNGLKKLSMDEYGLTAQGINVMTYTQGEFNEFTGHSPIARYDLPGGDKGHVITHHVAQIDMGANLMMYNWSAQDTEVVTGFKDPALFGNNGLIIRKEEFNQWGVKTFTYSDDGTGYNPLRSFPRPFYDYTANDQYGTYGGPFPHQPFGFEDAMEIGINLNRMTYDWVGGSNSWTYPVVTMNGNTYTPGPGHSFAVTEFVNKLPYIRVWYNDSLKKGWITGLYEGGPTAVTTTLNFLGIPPVNVRWKPGKPRFITFEVSDVVTP